MKVNWTVPALADVEAIVPAQFRGPLLDKLEGLLYVGQGRPCTDSRYPDALFIKYQYWFVMFLPAGESEVVVIGVEYNYGQSP